MRIDDSFLFLRDLSHLFVVSQSLLTPYKSRGGPWVIRRCMSSLRQSVQLPPQRWGMMFSSHQVTPTASYGATTMRVPSRFSPEVTPAWTKSNEDPGSRYASR